MSDLILVVEDNLANQMLVEAVLELEGYRVMLAGSADEAVEQIRAERPDLILMDLQLPGQDGLTFTRALKDDSSTREIPIVALTAHAMHGDSDLAFTAGCAGYIPKPIDTRLFPQQVRSFLADSAAGDRLVAP